MKIPKEKNIKGHRHIKFDIESVNQEESILRSANFYKEMNHRRSVREFSSLAVEKEVIESIIQTASTAPSGAHKQPWVFCAVSTSHIKKQISIPEEAEEREN